MSRFSNKNLVHVGDPYCAPSPFVIAEEAICVLRKLYEDAYWREEIKDVFLNICEKIEEASRSDLKVKKVTGVFLTFLESRFLNARLLFTPLDSNLDLLKTVNKNFIWVTFLVMMQNSFLPLFLVHQVSYSVY